MAMVESLRREDRIGLAVAFALHAALVAVFLMQPSKRVDIEPGERMTVNLASEVGLEATAPEPVPESRAAVAPTLADTPAPMPEPEPVPQPRADPQPRVERPAARPSPAPAAARPRSQPSRAAAAQPSAPPRPAPKPGGSRVGDNFLAGMGGSTTTDETRAPASAIGASTKASLFQAIGRAIKPHWQPPSGPDVDQIVTKVRFRLRPDGSLAGRPQVAGQSGVNDTNRTQAGRHGEQAIRAVQLAAPFDLPERYYEAWKTVSVDFDWKLAQ